MLASALGHAIPIPQTFDKILDLLSSRDAQISGKARDLIVGAKLRRLLHLRDTSPPNSPTNNSFASECQSLLVDARVNNVHLSLDTLRVAEYILARYGDKNMANVEAFADVVHDLSMVGAAPNYFAVQAYLVPTAPIEVSIKVRHVCLYFSLFESAMLISDLEPRLPLCCKLHTDMMRHWCNDLLTLVDEFCCPSVSRVRCSNRSLTQGAICVCLLLVVFSSSNSMSISPFGIYVEYWVIKVVW